MSAWRDCVTASLLGTDKGGALPAAPAALQEVLDPAARLEREARFLTHAGALALWRRAGWKPVPGETALSSVAPPESSGASVSAASVAHLRAMLSGHCAEVLPEWLGVVTEKQRRLPPEWLPGLLDRARQNRGLRPLVMAAGGARVRWLAGLNPDWNFAADDSPEHWETGGREQRLAILRGWRAEHPALAREKLEAVWSTEPADAREAFLALLTENLSSDDEPFLERALDDRGKDVRARASSLLTRLPESAFIARMVARAAPLLALKRWGLFIRGSAEVELPGEPDAAGKRDGLDPAVFGMYRKEFGDKAKLLIQILGATPLGHWTATSGQPPAALLKAVAKHEFAVAVATGWARAAIDQRDPVWAEALLDGPVQPKTGFVVFGGLFATLPAAAKAERLLAVIHQGITEPRFGGEGWPSLFARFAAEQVYLPENLVRGTFAAFRRAAHTETTGLPYTLHQMAEALGLKTPPALLPEAIDGWPDGQPIIASMIERLAFRRDALAALAQP